MAAINTLLSAVIAFLCAADRQQLQLQASHEFRILMVKMVRCEKHNEFEELREDYHKGLTNEPFLPLNFEVKEDFDSILQHLTL